MAEASVARRRGDRSSGRSKCFLYSVCCRHLHGEDGCRVLRVNGVAKRFRSRAGWIQAVEDVSFELDSGEILGFLGPNGAGKTTTIKMVAGLVTPDRGQIHVEGRDLARHRTRALAAIGAVLEGSRNIYWRMTPLENLVYWGMMRGLSSREAHARGLELLARVGLTDRRDTTVQTLSRGMQQKVALAAALVHAPRLLLLDEPTLGLDWQSGEDIKALVRALRDQGVAILLTTHQLDLAEELSDRIAIIRRGRLVLEGPTADVLARFSRNAFRVTLERPPLPEEQARLQALGFALDVSRPTEVLCLTSAGSDTRRDLAAVTDVLATLHGLPVESVARDRARLAEVFAEIVGSDPQSAADPGGGTHIPADPGLASEPDGTETGPWM